MEADVAVIKFNDTDAGQERRLLRGLIRKSKTMSKMDREVLMWLLERWFYHRSGKGIICPGVGKISHATELCERSVRYVLKRLREWGFIVAVKYAKGGRRATQYMVDTIRILRILGNVPETVQGELRPIDRPITERGKPCTPCRRNNTCRDIPEPGGDLPKPAEGREWLLGRFAAGLAAGLKRWIDPIGWSKRYERTKGSDILTGKTVPAVQEVPF